MFSIFRSVLVSFVLAMGLLPAANAPLAAQSGLITGTVTDAASGRPIENAQVQAQLGGGASYGAISGADGTFRVVNLPDGSYTVTVRALGYDQKVFPNQRPGAVITAALNERPTQLNQTVVTASRSRPEKALDAPAQISVISSERVEERPAVTVTDHLYSTPGVNIQQGGIAQSNVVARGFNNAFSGSLLMLQDYRFAGVPSLRVNIPFLLTGTNEDVDRIEVLLGPASALYGPNSSNGVLHVINKSPFQSQGTTISVDGGERSIIRGGLRHAGKVNEKLAYKLSGEYMQGRDWEYRDLQEPATFPSGGGFYIPQSRRGQPNQRDFDLLRYSGEARVDVRPREGMEAITTLGYSRIGNALDLTGFGTSQIRNWSYTSIQQRFRWNKLFLQAFLNSSNAGNDDSTSTDGTIYLRSGGSIVDKSRVFALQGQHGFDLGAKQSFTYGVDYINTNPQTGRTINGANEDVDQMREYGAYLQSSTRPVDKLELLLAFRGDGTNVIDGTFFSPRAALILKPTKNQNVRFTFNRAFSTPANFSFFLDLLSSPNAGGTAFDVRGRGNPPKTGFTFRRGCGTSQFGDFCMKSPFSGGSDYLPVSATSMYPGFVAGAGNAIAARIAQGLQASGLPATSASAIASAAIAAILPLRPTEAQFGTRAALLSAPTTNLTPDQVTPIRPLTASYNNTYEVGWKGIVNNRLRYDVSFWGQSRGDVGAPATPVTPSVFFANPAGVQGLLQPAIAGAITPLLAGLPAATQQAVLSSVIGGVVTAVASSPVGVITFDNPNARPNAVYATYLSSDKEIWVKGLDLAVDVVATDRLTFEAAYSWQDRTLFPGVYPAGQAPFASNSPGSRGSLGGRYRNESNGIGFELRTRYNEAYPVFSGAYATNVSYPIAAGNPGAPVGSIATGFNRCNPVPAGAFCYENVPEAVLFDAQFTKRFDLGSQRLMWSLSAQNLFDNRIRTFAGVPEVGRLVMTRIQYAF
ncbi:MAG: TonB-dependent receptor domain-containing protein [Gemmatimonas sp.]|jgi:outer membrane receptor for ferrienterochelin and colicins|uniref:TonB-dependent receptor n=1 Tax=Gemmatimonas sp. TaxID=1962908 RepID=UPI00391F019D|nr:TonB-dependent receptor [Gemmatimonadota bacterium]